MRCVILSAVVASDDTSLHVEAGDVRGGFLIIGRKAFIVLGSLAVLLSRLSPPGPGSAHKRKSRYLQSKLSTLNVHGLRIEVKYSRAPHTAGLLSLLSSADASALGTLHDRGQTCLD